MVLFWMSGSDNGSKEGLQMELGGIRGVVLGATANGGHSPRVLGTRVGSEHDAW